MAYLSPSTSGNRVATFGAVAALHGLAVFAILSGFAGGILQEIADNTLVAHNYPMPLDPPKPPPKTTPPIVQPEQHATVKPVQQVLPPLGESFQVIDMVPDRGLLPLGRGEDLGALIPQPTPSPRPALMPRAANPLNAPGLWVSDADYPTGALRRGEQGVTGFAITIGPDGRVRDCTITRSSGSAELDAATCAKVCQRARFAPASNEHGDAVVGRYANVIRWRIPE